MGEGIAGEPGEVDLEKTVTVEAAILQRVDRIGRLLEVDLAELVFVDDQDAVRLEIAQIGFERRRIHRHQDVGRIARGMDVVIGDAHLECRNTGQGAGGGANFRGEVRQGRKVVAEDRRGGGELRAGELHAVAAVAGKTDDHVREFLVHGFRVASRGTCGDFGVCWNVCHLGYLPAENRDGGRQEQPLRLRDDRC